MFFVILICKILKFIGKLIGKGSSFPGQVALKLDKNILNKIKLPKYIIAVTGSNGKTSTVEMIAHILKSADKTVAYNKEGANQIQGITTLILSNCTLLGKMKQDILLLESDERYAKHTFKYFNPTHYVVTNLYRDQLSRNGHPQWVYNDILQSIYSEKTQLVLNADDPLVSLLGYNRKNNKYFGIDKFSGSTLECTSVYNDGYYCINCFSEMKYDYYNLAHLGKYSCPKCGHKKNNTDFTVTSVDFENSFVIIDNDYKINISINGLFNVYNLLSAFAISSICGVDKNIIAQAINNYVLQNGRIINFELGKHNGTFLTSKHENSVSYDTSIKIATDYKDDCTVLIIVDEISRKYFTSETSWLWDINFDNLKSENVKNIVLAGQYVSDLLTRFNYSEVNMDKIKSFKDVYKALDYLSQNGEEKVFAITCFSDKHKLLNKVKIL